MPQNGLSFGMNLSKPIVRSATTAVIHYKTTNANFVRIADSSSFYSSVRFTNKAVISIADSLVTSAFKKPWSYSGEV